MTAANQAGRGVLTEERVREIIREELRALVPKQPKPAKPCGRGSAIPQCMGSAARGHEHCTCPGVQIEYYDGTRRY